MRKVLIRICVVLFALHLAPSAKAQGYANGADVSFLAKCEQDGVVFKENGKPVDVLVLLREHHYNWVRLRIFHDPAAAPDKLPNDLPYTLALARRAKGLGFHILLDLHYSDSWADPGKQTTPAAWSKLKHKQLVEQVFAYTRDTIAAFAAQGLMPDMVQVGNEVTDGMLWPDGKLPDNWDNFADLLKAGIAGVNAGRGAAPKPRIMVHIERSGNYDSAVMVLRQPDRAPCSFRRNRALLLSLLARQSGQSPRQSARSCPALQASDHHSGDCLQLDSRRQENKESRLS